MTAVPTTPVVGQPVVVGHTKYRIVTIGHGAVVARKRVGGAVASALVAALSWDRRAGLWRKPCPGCPECAA